MPSYFSLAFFYIKKHNNTQKDYFEIILNHKKKMLIHLIIYLILFYNQTPKTRKTKNIFHVVN